MKRLGIALLRTSLMLCISQVTLAQDSTFTIKGSDWTDTRIDLAAGDTVQISASTSDSSISATKPCAPEGNPTSADKASLPMPSAPAGALIAKLYAHGAAPMLVGKGTELHAQSASHLFLAMNFGTTPQCDGSLNVSVHKIAVANGGKTPSSSAATSSATASASSSSPSTSSTSEQSRGEQLKSQLSTAAQIFMQGQFGTGKSESDSAGSNVASGGNSASSTVPTLQISDAPLDSDLRRQIDSLPRRVNDQFQHLGDMVNFVIVGDQKDVQSALEAANWHVADTNNEKAVLNAVLETYEKKDYLAMPMSVLYLFGRGQDFGYEQAEPIAMAASRHHFRIWKASFTWNGKQVWVGAGTHDIGFAKDQRNGSVTHKIDPAVDGERANIGASLQKSGKIKSLSYYLPPNPVQEAKNATGDGYHSDGRILVSLLQ